MNPPAPIRLKVNILLTPVGAEWQASAHRADNGILLHKTEPYRDKPSAIADAKHWARKNGYLIGRIVG